MAFGVATKYNYLVREPEEFGMPVDGKMGFTLLDSSGSVKRLIPSPMFGLVARASLPIMTILQKTYVSIQFSDINCEAYNNFTFFWNSLINSNLNKKIQAYLNSYYFMNK